MSEFERCWPWLAAANELAGGTHSKEDLWRMVQAGTAQLHPMHRSAILTTINTYPTGKREGLFWLAGGDLAELATGEPLICELFKSEGCDWATIRGRKGWKRTFPTYKEAGTFLVKEL